MLLAALVVLSRASLCTASLCSVNPTPPQESEDRLGAVASLDARCSAIGVDILRKGGNAADATVAAQFCSGVIGMYNTGISGGSFMLIRDSARRFEFVDFRETVPAASSETMFNNNVTASILIPGEIRGLQYLHSKYGSLPWEKLVDPSVKLARDGFLVGTDFESQMDRIDDQSLFLDPIWAPEFSPQGRRLMAGDLMKRPKYAETLEIIRDRGPDAFYSGFIASTMVAALQDNNGVMRLEDLQDYQVVNRQLRSIQYDGYRITGGGSPAGGVVSLSILNALKGYSDRDQQSAVNLTSHRLSEIMRFAFGAVTYQTGDPKFVDGLELYEEAMLSQEFAAEIRGKISDEHTQPVEAYNPDGLESLETPGTAHISAADASGLAISLTSTINLTFRSRLMVPESDVEVNTASQVLVQNGFDNGTVAYLEERGHTVVWVESGHGSDLQLVRRLPNGAFDAASEPRQAQSGGFAV
ncbi:nucleophile aminohydrolase [Bombardia bombarda]|uniref:Nucleophile aminohydrolase n=1 Tax=Bombardia bombarda TaxID=252184 RepID=A0AA40C8E0_9PEZI|nr:nucleophile aminohydrolase [Bombardia bombarda]